MKALSLMPYWADAVLFGDKTIECRTWKTDYRGNLLICASSRRQSGFVVGCAVCVVTLTAIEPLASAHLKAAGLDEMPERPSYAWHLEDVGWIRPFPTKGALHLFDVDDSLIEPVRVASKAEYEAALRGLYLPHVYFSRGDTAARDYWEEIAGLK